MSETSPNPFLRARREFENVFTNLARARRNWQLVAFAALGLLGLRIVQDGYITVTSRIVPYVVEVDRVGRAQAFGPAEPLKQTDTRVTIAQLATFIRNLRMIVPDANVQADFARDAYAYVTPTAATFLNSYYGHPENDPRRLSAQLTRLVTVTSVVRMPGTTTWKVAWRETDIPHQAGLHAMAADWEAYLITTTIPPKTTETIQHNPLGLYVTSMTWTRVASDTAAIGSQFE